MLIYVDDKVGTNGVNVSYLYRSYKISVYFGTFRINSVVMSNTNKIRYLRSIKT